MGRIDDFLRDDLRDDLTDRPSKKKAFVLLLAEDVPVPEGDLEVGPPKKRKRVSIKVIGLGKKSKGNELF